jgi:hypothetical protein
LNQTNITGISFMNHDTYNQTTQNQTYSTPNTWSDFNDADAQQGEFNLIPKGTQAMVRMAIKPGGYDDLAQGWTGGYATASDETGAVFLSCEFVVLTGPFAKRKIWSNVGLHSQKGPTWGQMGRSFIKAVLNSARNIHPDDNSPEAQRARQIRGFSELDGSEFVARIGIEKDGKGELRNIIRLVIEPDHKDYEDLMAIKLQRDGSFGGGSGSGSGGAPAMAAPTSNMPASQTGTAYTPRPGNAQGRPTWAQ